MPPTRLPRLALSASLATALSACSPSAIAELGGTVSLQSDGRYRGISYSEHGPQAQVTLAYDDSPSGWYGGGLLTQTRFAGERPNAFVQGYLGRVAMVTVGLDADAGLSLHHFDSISRYDYAEAYVGLLGERWNARLSYANDYYGSRQRSLYGELNLDWPLTPSTLAFAHLGVIRGSAGPFSSPHGLTRLDLRVGAGWRLGLCELQLAWLASTRGGPYTWADERRRQTVVLGVSAAF
jgi:uncharacterized protein (TIGR02001 family)